MEKDSQSGPLQQEEDNSQTKSLKVLMVDDLIFDSMFVAEIVLPKMEGLVFKQILYAENGIEAVKTYQQNPNIDLILMNIQMPKMDGFEATRQIRYFNKEVIIIAQTETAYEYVRDKMKVAGCNDYIRKPIEKELLFELIKKYFINH
jgi:CheY-like chemotaxis protein